MINSPSSRLTALALVAALGAVPAMAQTNSTTTPAAPAATDAAPATSAVIDEAVDAAKETVDGAVAAAEAVADDTDKPATETPADAAPAQGAASGTPAANAEAPAAAPAGQAAPQDLGKPYVAEVTGDWQIECLRTTLDADPCRLVQILLDQGNPTMRVEIIALPEGGPAPAVATFYSPLETLLSEQITLSVDGGQQSKHMFNYCTPQFCIAQVPFADSAIAAFKRGNSAEASIVPLQAPDKRATLKLSLAGFTAGYDRLVELSKASTAAIRKAAEAAPKQ